ncbi:MAG TPA: hypothetical protein VMV45_15145 [Casimicrobiaceae bacterium]|nr:hypothetical protein [Casimicrobiaceae bacterium]
MFKPRTLLSILLNAVAILICGLAGGVAGFALARAFGMDGIPGAVLATIIAMVVASLAWAVGAVVLRTLRIIR